MLDKAVTPGDFSCIRLSLRVTLADVDISHVFKYCGIHMTIYESAASARIYIS